jgi:hypothetical protein
LAQKFWILTNRLLKRSWQKRESQHNGEVSG